MSTSNRGKPARFEVPAGYVLVPIEPTRTMTKAMAGATFKNDGSHIEYVRRWNGALSALSRSRKYRELLASLGLQPSNEG